MPFLGEIRGIPALHFPFEYKDKGRAKEGLKMALFHL
jgi:hypothetical protein